MTFLNASLLAGTALIAVPIILHLIMRRKPTLFEFPALAIRAKKARHQPAEIKSAAHIAVIAASGDNRIFGIRPGPAQRAIRRGIGQPGGPGRRGAWSSTPPRAWNICAKIKPGSRPQRKWACGFWPNCRRKAKSPCSIPAKAQARSRPTAPQPGTASNAWKPCPTRSL